MIYGINPVLEALRAGRVEELRVSERASGNKGHEYGAHLLASEKDALIEYLKTL